MLSLFPVVFYMLRPHPGSGHDSRKTTPVVQVLPATHMPSALTGYTTTGSMLNDHHTPTGGSIARSKKEGTLSSQGRKALFVGGGGTQDIKRNVETRWQEEFESEAARIHRVAPSKVVSGGAEESFNVPPNMEETMNQTMFVNSEQRRVMGSPLRASYQGHRSTSPLKSPNGNGYVNPYHNPPVNISPEYLTRTHSSTSHYNPADLYAPQTNYASLPRTHDLNDWQRLQQHQLQAQLEQLHITSQTLGSTYSSVGLSGTSTNSIGFNDDLGKVEGLIRAKEAILHEKNMVIER